METDLQLRNVVGGIQAYTWTRQFTEIAADLKDATEHAKGKRSGVVEHSPGHMDVKAIREKTGMSQERFCATFGISLGTLRHGNRDCGRPEAPREYS